MSSIEGVSSTLKLVDLKSAPEGEGQTNTFQHLRATILTSLTEVVNKQLADFLNEFKAGLCDAVKTTCDDFDTRLTHVEAELPKLTINAEMKEQITKNTDDLKEQKAFLDAQKLKNEERTLFETKTNKRVGAVEQRCDVIEVDLDSVEQQGRKETVEFHNFPFHYGHNGREDTTEMVVCYCNKYLNMNISRKDISVSHRQTHPDEKRRHGDKYIPPIYCKFVSRDLAHLCMKNKTLLTNRSSREVKPIQMKENLTYKRRHIRNRVEKELHSYRYKWVKNGKVFVRKDNGCRSIRILTEKTLDDLLKEQKEGERKRTNDDLPPRNGNDSSHWSRVNRNTWREGNRSRNAQYHRRDSAKGPPSGHRRPNITLYDYFANVNYSALPHSFSSSSNRYTSYRDSVGRNVKA